MKDDDVGAAESEVLEPAHHRVRFVEQVGGRSAIGDLDAAVAVLAGESGTSIVSD